MYVTVEGDDRPVAAIDTVYDPAADGVIVNVPVGDEPAVSTTGDVVTVAVPGVTVTVTLVFVAREPLVPIVKLPEAAPTKPLVAPGAVSVNALAAP